MINFQSLQFQLMGPPFSSKARTLIFDFHPAARDPVVTDVSWATLVHTNFTEE